MLAGALVVMLTLLVPGWGQSRGLREVVVPSGQRLSLYDGSHAVAVLLCRAR